jgi:hypothetical protein
MTRRRDFEAGKQAFENVLELASAKKSLVQIRGLGTLSSGPSFRRLAGTDVHP